MKKYNAQAIAIVMIVLMILTIIALALFSRNATRQQVTTKTESSNEGEQVANSILELSLPTIKEVIENEQIESCTTEELNSSEGCTIQGIDSITEIINGGDLRQTFDLCLEKDTSNANLNLKFASNSDPVIISRDSTFTLKAQEGLLDNTGVCSSSFEFVSRDNNSGFIITKNYAQIDENLNPTTFKPYEEDDVIGYCFVETINDECFEGDPNSNYVSSDGWIKFVSGDEITLDMNETKTYDMNGPYAPASDQFPLYEFKVRAINNEVKINMQLNTNCFDTRHSLLATADVNCNGTSRVKSLSVPIYNFNLPLFDHTIYNGNGILRYEL